MQLNEIYDYLVFAVVFTVSRRKYIGHQVLITRRYLNLQIAKVTSPEFSLEAEVLSSKTYHLKTASIEKLGFFS